MWAAHAPCRSPFLGCAAEVTKLPRRGVPQSLRGRHEGRVCGRGKTHPAVSRARGHDGPAAPAPARNIGRAVWVRLIARTPECCRQRMCGLGRHTLKRGDLKWDVVRRVVPACRARASEVQGCPGRGGRPGLQMGRTDSDPFGRIPDHKLIPPPTLARALFRVGHYPAYVPTA